MGTILPFVFATWNVEKFRGGDATRLKLVADCIKAAHPDNKPVDIFGLQFLKEMSDHCLLVGEVG
jgi:hypothetical protein